MHDSLRRRLVQALQARISHRSATATIEQNGQPQLHGLYPECRGHQPKAQQKNCQACSRVWGHGCQESSATPKEGDIICNSNSGTPFYCSAGQVRGHMGMAWHFDMASRVMVCSQQPLTDTDTKCYKKARSVAQTA